MHYFLLTKNRYHTQRKTKNRRTFFLYKGLKFNMCHVNKILIFGGILNGMLRNLKNLE